MNAPSHPPSNHLPVRPEWLALRTEEIIEPDLPIVDPHHHLWDKPGNRYFFPELLADLQSGHNVRATVFIQCDAMYRADGDPDLICVGETEFVNGVAAMSASGHYGEARACAGIVGYADLRLGDGVKRVLEAHLAAGGGRFRGVRNMSVYHKDPAAHTSLARPPEGLLLDAGLRKGLQVLTRMGLTLDSFMYHTQMHELVDLARAVPDAQIVLNHISAPLGVGPYEGKRQEVFANWSKSIAEVAKCPNVNVKLGGFGMRMFGFTFQNEKLPPTSEQLAEAWKPYVEHTISVFGPDRCMFESNFPVDKGTCSYAALWNAFKRIAKPYSAAEKTAMFSGTAARFYRLSIP
jgi:L-fuconolactonase